MKFETFVTAQTKAAEAYAEVIKKELNVEVPSFDTFVDQAKDEVQRLQTAFTSPHAYGEYVKENIRRVQESAKETVEKTKEFFAL